MSASGEVSDPVKGTGVFRPDVRTRMAAGRAEHVLETVVGAFSLLNEEIGDHGNPLNRDVTDGWCQVIYWLSTLLENERRDLKSALGDTAP